MSNVEVVELCEKLAQRHDNIIVGVHEEIEVTSVVETSVGTEYVISKGSNTANQSSVAACHLEDIRRLDLECGEMLTKC